MHSPSRFQLRSLRARARNPRSAFTILELLLVLVILAVLAGIATVYLPGVVGDSKRKAALTDMEAIKSALGLFELKAGRFPTTSEGLLALVEQPANVKEWKRTLDKDSVPLDPWGNPWNYRAPGNHRTDAYDLWSNGEDGKEGSDDDVANWTK